MKARVEITPELALDVLRSLPELIPLWVKERGGVYKLYSKLGYSTPQAADNSMNRRKKSGWSLRSLIQWLEVLNEDTGLVESD